MRQTKSFGAVYRQTQICVREIESEQLMTITSETAEMYEFEGEHVNAVESTFPKRLIIELSIEGTAVRFQIDTGASCNVIRRNDIPDASRTQIIKTTQRLRLYDNSIVQPIGEFRTNVVNPRTCKSHSLYS